MKIGWCARDDAGRPLVPGEPVLKSGRGGWSAPWTVALEHVEQIRLIRQPLRAHILQERTERCGRCAG